jgi:hypothetical protein
MSSIRINTTFGGRCDFSRQSCGRLDGSDSARPQAPAASEAKNSRRVWLRFIPAMFSASSPLADLAVYLFVLSL